MELLQDASKVLVEEILEQSRIEEESVLESAKKEAGRLIKEAEKEAQVYRNQQMKTARDEADHIEKKISSGVHLELKKQRMRMRESLINRMLEAVEKQLNVFRNDKNYSRFLEKMIVQGILALDSKEVDVVLAKHEKAILKQNKIIEMVKSEGAGDVKITLHVSDRDEGGALIESKDGRTRFDNRFSALIKRNMDSLQLTVMKEVFGNPS